PFVAALAAVAAAFVAPQLWLLSLSLKSKAAVYEFPPRWIPSHPTAANYWFALTSTQVPWYLWNSVVVALVATATTMAIATPAASPGLAAAAIFNLAAYWSEFSLALVLLDSQERFTMPLGLFSFQSAYETDWQLLAAASFIGLVPVMIAFVLLQRFFVAGLTA